MPSVRKHEVIRRLHGHAGEWLEAGSIGVDAGLCWIGDPCYIIHSEGNKNEDLGEDWDEFCTNLNAAEEAARKVDGFQKDRAVNWGHVQHISTDPDGKGGSDVIRNEGLGVVVHTGHGDGRYPVLVRRNHECRIIAAMVVFDEGEVFSD